MQDESLPRPSCLSSPGLGPSARGQSGQLPGLTGSRRPDQRQVSQGPK